MVTGSLTNKIWQWCFAGSYCGQYLDENYFEDKLSVDNEIGAGETKTSKQRCPHCH